MDEPRKAYSILEAAEALGISRATIYRMLDADQIRSVYLRGRRLIPASEVDRLTTLPAGNEK